MGLEPFKTVGVIGTGTGVDVLADGEENFVHLADVVVEHVVGSMGVSCVSVSREEGTLSVGPVRIAFDEVVDLLVDAGFELRHQGVSACVRRTTSPFGPARRRM